MGNSEQKKIESLKDKLRRRILHLLKIQKEEVRCRKSRQIKEALFRSLLFKKAKIIMFYLAGKFRRKRCLRKRAVPGRPSLCRFVEAIG
jgi:hypothetical protein